MRGERGDLLVWETALRINLGQDSTSPVTRFPLPHVPCHRLGRSRQIGSDELQTATNKGPAAGSILKTLPV
jgi:hypothetical protein